MCVCLFVLLSWMSVHTGLIELCWRNYRNYFVLLLDQLHSVKTDEGCVSALTLNTSLLAMGLCSCVFHVGLGLILLSSCNLHQPALPSAWDFLSFQAQEDFRKVSISLTHSLPVHYVTHTALCCTGYYEVFVIVGALRSVWNLKVWKL